MSAAILKKKVDEVTSERQIYPHANFRDDRSVGLAVKPGHTDIRIYGYIYIQIYIQTDRQTNRTPPVPNLTGPLLGNYFPCVGITSKINGFF